MHKFYLLAVLVLSACAQSQPAANVISQYDILMNRPNTDRPEALFRMFADGSGTVDFMGNASGPQDIRWSMRGPFFCIDRADGILGTFGCARLTIDGQRVTLAHTETDGVVTGTLKGR